MVLEPRYPQNHLLKFPPRPASTFKISVASEVVAQSILLMLRIEGGSLYSWIQLENERLHSFTSAKDDTRIHFLSICSRGFCKPANSYGGYDMAIS